jgi:hypothetical protein
VTEVVAFAMAGNARQAGTARMRESSLWIRM